MPSKRRNKSSKVPNVKLRPAAPVARISKSRHTTQSTLTHDTDLQTDSQPSFADLCPRPFRDVVLCATGISDKMTLFKQALELGASSMNDLTDRVTHLIAIEPGSAKYKCALESRIPIMQPSFVTESHKIWLKGDDVDLRESEERHRLPIFSGVILSISGIENVQRRTQINRLVTQHGGAYVKNLERPVKVTHLLCSSTNEEVTEKMKYAEKFNQRREAKIRLVWEEWFWDSLEYGGRWDEETYKVSEPPPKRKSLPEATPPPLSSSPADDRSSGKTPESSTPSCPAAFTDLLNLEEHEEEIASVKRVPAVTLQIWESLLKPRGFEIQEGKLVRSLSKSQASAAKENHGESEDEPNVRESSTIGGKGGRPAAATTKRSENVAGPSHASQSLLSSFRRANSFAPAHNNTLTQRQPFIRLPTAGPSSSSLPHPRGNSLFAEGDSDNAPAASSSSRGVPSLSQNKTGEAGEHPEPAVSFKSTHLFAGLTFRLRGEAKTPNVRSAVEASGGCLVSDGSDEDVNYVIVRLISGSAIFQGERDEAERAKYRTECWLERCLFEERICPPEEHVAFVPLRIETPIPGAERINLSYSGLEQSELHWLRRLTRALGANLAPKFSRRSTHLLCPSGVGAKADKAREWNIPIMTMAWLADMASTGVVPPIENYVTIRANTAEAEPAAAVAQPESVMELEPLRVDRKGKGKQRAPDCTMVESAHGYAASQSPIEVLHDAPSDVHPDLGNDIHLCENNYDDPFGHPSALLGGSLQKRLPNATPPLSRSTTRGDSSGPSYPSSPARILVEDSHSSFANIGRDRITDRIPSSESPSPMKLPNKNGFGRSRPSSPAQISKQATKVLQESITTLLGKRPSSEDDSAGKESHTRLGKKARPPSRAKPQSQQGLAKPADLELLPVAIPAAGNINSNADGQSADESMRVTYEDPHQRDEQKRLMRLLSSQKLDPWEVNGRSVEESSSKGVRKGRGATRKGARIAGF